jgi:hypothetical protein
LADKEIRKATPDIIRGSLNMAQIIDPIPTNCSDKRLCCYVNPTSKIQIARITNVSNWYFERVVFPAQRLMFEAPSQAVLEIHTSCMAGAVVADTIPCDRLQLKEDTSLSQPKTLISSY